MKKNSQNFSQEDIQRLAQDPTAHQLLTLLHRDPEALSDAISQAKTGNYQGAIDSLSGILSHEDVKALLNRLGGSNNG